VPAIAAMLAVAGSPPTFHATPVAQALGHDPINIAPFRGRFDPFVYANFGQVELGAATGCRASTAVDP
jgi:hypothetical protein